MYTLTCTCGWCQPYDHDPEPEALRHVTPGHDIECRRKERWAAGELNVFVFRCSSAVVPKEIALNGK